MKGFIGLTKRNLLLFFKDKQSVAFSLLTSIIVLALYLLFLKGTFVDSITGVIDSHAGLGGLITDGDISMFANLILLTGILGSAMITVPFNCLTGVVKDRENRIDYDILSTPIRRGGIILSYFVSASVSSIILNGIILAVGLVTIGLQGDVGLSVVGVVKAFGVVSLGSVSATALFMPFVLLFKSSNASGAFFGILSAAAGFVIGAYIPISQFSKGVQTVCNLFPASQITIILRNILTTGLLNRIDSGIGGLDNGLFVASVKDIFTFKAFLFTGELTVGGMLIYIVGVIVLSILAQIIMYSKTYKKK